MLNEKNANIIWNTMKNNLLFSDFYKELGKQGISIYQISEFMIIVQRSINEISK